MAADPSDQTNEIERRFYEAYAKYGKPLEEQHTGEFLAISPTGETLITKTLAEAETQGYAKFGRGIFVYKIGPIGVGWIR